MLKHLLVCAALALPLSAAKADMTMNPDGTVSWSAGVDGVSIEWGANGAVSRLISRFSQPVSFPDRRGINTAQIVAEEKAKAAIIRFMDQNVTTGRVVDEVNQEMETAARNRSGVGENWSLQNTRNYTQSLREFVSSVASGNLRGVIVLERGYDETLEEAWVVVGISANTINAAQGVQDMIEGKVAPTLSPHGGGGGSLGPTKDFPSQGTDIRRNQIQF